MATKLARLKSQLLNSGLQIKDNALWQVINSLIGYVEENSIAIQDSASSGGSSTPTGITDLFDDVVATGPGSVSAIIQPGVVTYSKIQDTVLADILIGRGLTPGTVEEIRLGANLLIQDGVLEISTSGGGTGGGLAHNLLSPTHPDTVPASPVVGDMIYAEEGDLVIGEYYSALIIAPVIEEGEGIFAQYYAGYNGLMIPTESMGMSGPNLPTITYELPDVWLAWKYIDAFALALAEEEFIGIRAGYTFASDPINGNYGQYYPPAYNIVAPESPANPSAGSVWTKIEIGAEDDYLKVSGGIPTWAPFPTIPTPPDPDYSWQDIPFSAGDFTATGGGTWTVAAGDVARWQFQQFPGNAGVGNNVRIALFVQQTTVAGTVTQLHVTIPFNVIGKFALFVSIQENGAAVDTTYVIYDDSVSTTQVTIAKIGGGTFDTTAGQTYIAFEISAVLAP